MMTPEQQCCLTLHRTRHLLQTAIINSNRLQVQNQASATMNDQEPVILTENGGTLARGKDGGRSTRFVKEQPRPAKVGRARKAALVVFVRCWKSLLAPMRPFRIVCTIKSLISLRRRTLAKPIMGRVGGQIWVSLSLYASELSSPGSTGRSSKHRPGVQDCPVKPGNYIHGVSAIVRCDSVHRKENRRCRFTRPIDGEGQP
jgi:hypothetical protein